MMLKKKSVNKKKIYFYYLSFYNLVKNIFKIIK